MFWMKRGVLATVAASCADRLASIEGVELSERGEEYSEMKLTLGVKDRKHLADILKGIKTNKNCFQSQ